MQYLLLIYQSEAEAESQSEEAHKATLAAPSIATTSC